MRSPAVHGFTLLELMVAVAVLGILLGVGVPAFREMMAANRLTSMVNEIVTAFTVARSEARKRGIPVTLCAANAQQDGCEDTAEWNDGWIVFTDDIGTPGVVDDDDEVLQVFPAPPAGFAVTATLPTTMSYVRFQRSGAPDPPSARTLKLTRPDCSGSKARQISIASMGRVASAKVAC
jgi:type IV fimbrial biogenesis protein FimT